jgi:V-type H+-transporting ATPase subunit H
MNKLTKEITIQYVLTLMDDILQDSKHRVELFHAYAKKYNENIYSTFQKMLYNHDYFITNQTSRIISKLACWSNSLMNEKDLRDYFVWIQDQLDEKVNFLFKLISFKIHLL